MKKTYRAIRHDVIRKKQRENDPSVHHPTEKINQINRILKGLDDLRILELFCGEGNLTKVYSNYGEVDGYDKKVGTGDSYRIFHKLIYDKASFDVIDLDPYGFPNRFFPDIFLLIDNGYMFITMPKPFVNVLNGITQQHLTCYYDNPNPDIETICNKIYNYGLCHWREIKYLDIIDLGRLWRLAISVNRVKATEYCGVRNRPEKKGNDKQLTIF